MANVEVEQVNPVAEENVEVPTKTVEEPVVEIQNRGGDIVETECAPTLAALTEQESEEEKKDATETPVVVEEEKKDEAEEVVAPAEKAEE
ncbi:hypothetical protein AALP_AA7G134600 [Arabis alpina]|uniref:Uncharacterized protein n=1 Tax=Arabis alpina TaxID=50452 RepID=A0A087GHT8_ARAAL|nr:hypothetical protein AALP_AA7G134600 [Arabis alpina]